MSDNAKEILGELYNYESIQHWLLQLEMKSAGNDNGGIPKDTLFAAKQAIVNYLKYRNRNGGNMTPDDLIAEVNEELQKTGKLSKCHLNLKLFWQWHPAKTTARQYFAMMKSFYKANDIPVFTETPPMPTIRKATRIPTSQEIRAICDVAPIQHATWIITNNYLGLRIGAIKELIVEDFQTENWKEDRPLYPVYISKQISGTFAYTQYIGRDAMLMLKTYFHKMRFTPHDHPWPYNRNYLNCVFKKYAYLAGVIDAPNGVNVDGVPKGLNAFHTHCLRKRSQTLHESCGTNTNWVDHLHGHIPRGANGKNYSFPDNCTPDDLYNEVLKCLPKKEIYGHHELSPTEANVEIQRLVTIEAAKRLPSMTPEKLSELENLLKCVRTKQEMDGVLSGTFDVIGGKSELQNIIKKWSEK